MRLSDIGKYPIITKMFRNEYGYSCQFKVTVEKFTIEQNPKGIGLFCQFYCPEVKKYIAWTVPSLEITEFDYRYFRTQVITHLYNSVRYA